MSSNSQDIKVFDSVASMVADSTLQAGQKVKTLSYHAGAAVGGNVYEIINMGNNLADGGSFINLSVSMLQAKGMFPDGRVNVTQFGALGGLDSTEAFKSATAFTSQLYVAGFEQPYLISERIRSWVCRRLLADNAKVEFTSETEQQGFYFPKADGVRISGFSFTTSGRVDQFVAALGGKDIVISDNIFDHDHCSSKLTLEFGGGLLLGAVSQVRIENNVFKNGWRDHRYHAGNFETPDGKNSNNLRRSVYISNSGQSDIKICNNSFINICAGIYTANCSDLQISGNTMTEIAGTAIMERCTGGVSRCKRITNNVIREIGKSAIKTLDTNNDTGAWGEDSIVEGNTIENWAMYIKSPAILAANHYTSVGYERSENLSNTLKISNNNVYQSKQCLSGEPIFLNNIKDVYIEGNSINPMDSVDDIFHMAFYCSNVKVSNNDFNFNGKVYLTYKHEGKYNFSNNTIVSSGALTMYKQTSGIEQSLIFSNNDVYNTGTEQSLFYGVGVINMSSGFKMVCTGNHFKVNATSQDGFGGDNINLIGLPVNADTSQHDSHIIDSNLVEFTDKICTQNMIAGDLLHPVHFRGLAGAAKVDGNTIIYKASNMRSGDVYTV
ncbi:MAG: right-handed parallel beta-helix repeat-containing protein [Marinobacterium sp.]|nr:right-handed parallel beta-helix repeat-containing protein [Marinobacterium sp.]